MPILKNTRHERFCQLRASGKSQDESYTEAGFKQSRTNAARLSSKEPIRARIEEILAAAAKTVEIDTAWVLEKLVHNGTAAMAEGDRSAANRSFELLGKHLGIFKEKIELGGHVQVLNTDLLQRMTPEERADMRALLLAAQARRPDAANQNGVVPPALSRRVVEE